MANPQPTDAHIRIAHSINEQIMVSDFSKRQRKILDLILRLSWGCGKKYAIIPHQNDFEIVGVYKTDIKAELDYLVQSKVIFINGDNYQFNKDYDQWRVSLSRKYTPQRVSELLTLNLKAVSVSLTAKLVKHEPDGKQNTNFPTPELASPKETIKKYINKDKRNTKRKDIPDFIDKGLWADFLEMRKKQKAPPTDRAIELLLKELGRLHHDGNNANEVLEQSIKNGWKGLFPLKGDNHNGKSGRNISSTRVEKQYTRPEDRRY